MTSQEFLHIVSAMNDAERHEIRSLLEITLIHPEARKVIRRCTERGLDLDDTLAEVSRKLVTTSRRKSTYRGAHVAINRM
jgi:hypothetical protein